MCIRDSLRDVDIPQVEAKFGLFKLCKDYSNKLLFTSSKGLMIYDPKVKVKKHAAVSCKVRNYTFEENNYGKNKLNIEYIAMDAFIKREKTYRTKLIGYEDKWSKATNETKTNFTNLNAVFLPKTYHFNLQAKDANDNWVPMEQPLEIKVQPPLWFRWWAFLLYAFLIYLLVKYFLKIQEANLRKSLLVEEAEKIKEKNIIIEEKNAQNELLLKEIHHRVKNNLQTISSLLFLQSASISDDDAKDALKAVQQRVESMALIHKKLYEESDLSQIEMKGYVQLLVDSLIDSFDFTNKIKVEYNVDDVKMEMDHAIPIGLLITELVTNSLKYAFPEKENGILNVDLEQKNGQIKLFVKDNGKGKHSEAKESFGSKLIKLLNRQIEGDLSHGNDHGYWTNIEFKINKPLEVYA